MNNPKVSVIIPVYNTEAYVEQTLRSIMGQTLRDIELIVVNDGSTDGSLSVLERIATGDDRIRLFTQPNKGLSQTRNAGIARARGEFIYFMDSDDLLEPDALERCYERCQSDRLDFVFFDAESFGTTRGYSTKTNSSPRSSISGRRVQAESNARSSSGAYTGIRSWDAGSRAATSKAIPPYCAN